jgi:pimeloyl-ACP methyl ester carboxylesterase
MREAIDYDECGPTVVLVPGSCSTGAAWRPVIWPEQPVSLRDHEPAGIWRHRGGRTASNPSISHEADALEAVVRRAGGRVHLVGHSFGGLVALAVALRNKVRLASLVIVEAPAAEILREAREHQHYRAFRRMTEAYFADFEGGNLEAIAAMIDLRRRRHIASTAAAGPGLRVATTRSTSSVGQCLWFPLARHRWLPSTSRSRRPRRESHPAVTCQRAPSERMRGAVSPRSMGPRTHDYHSRQPGGSVDCRHVRSADAMPIAPAAGRHGTAPAITVSSGRRGTRFSAKNRAMAMACAAASCPWLRARAAASAP